MVISFCGGSKPKKGRIPLDDIGTSTWCDVKKFVGRENLSDR